MRSDRRPYRVSADAFDSSHGMRDALPKGQRPNVMALTHAPTPHDTCMRLNAVTSAGRDRQVLRDAAIWTAEIPITAIYTASITPAIDHAGRTRKPETPRSRS